MGIWEKKILFLSADPSDASRLRLGQEMREIRERLQLAKERNNFSLFERMSVRPSDITQAIFDTKPNIIHFAGHGTRDGELCFEDELGKIRTINPESLGALFELLADQIDCVVLNACFSEIQAKAIAQYIDYVIGMKKEIGDKAAIAFAVGFYKALGAGYSIEESYNFGVVEIRLLNIPEHLTPILLKRHALEQPHFTRILEWKTSPDGRSRSRRNFPQYPDYAILELNDSQSIYINPTSYSSIQSLLDDLFIHYLSPFISPYSYGSDWVLLGEPFHTQLVAPWEWISNTDKPIHKLSPTWARSTLPSQQNIFPGSSWEIVMKEGRGKYVFQSIIGRGAFAIASNNEQLVQKILTDPKAIAFLYDEEYFTSRSIDEVDKSKYRFKYVFYDWLRIGLKGTILEDSGKQLDQDMFF